MLKYTLLYFLSRLISQLFPSGNLEEKEGRRDLRTDLLPAVRLPKKEEVRKKCLQIEKHSYTEDYMRRGVVAHITYFVCSTAQLMK